MAEENDWPNAMGCWASREPAGPAPGAVQFAQAMALEKPPVKTAEQLATEAELAELRRLTPEQEAAAAEAAQRIKGACARSRGCLRVGLCSISKVKP